MKPDERAGPESRLDGVVGPKHPYCLRVDVGDGAVMSAPNPTADPHVEWTLRYGHQFGGASRSAELSAASALDSYDYLLSDHINMKEATRRLRLMRSARRAALTPNASLSRSPAEGGDVGLKR